MMRDTESLEEMAVAAADAAAPNSPPKQGITGTKKENPPPPAPQPPPNQREVKTNNQKCSLNKGGCVHFVRLVVFAALLLTAVFVSMGIYYYAKEEQEKRFLIRFEASAERLKASFLDIANRNLLAMDAMATGITSYALTANESFPMLTIPHFLQRASLLRVQTGALMFWYAPMVRDKDRRAWEDYALEHRDAVALPAFYEDTNLTRQQDERFGFRYGGLGLGGRRSLQQQDEEEENSRNETQLEDSFHPKIWSVGFKGPRGDDPPGNGPYLPLWHSSPVDSKCVEGTNMNLDTSKALRGVIDMLESERDKAVMMSAIVPVKRAFKIISEKLQRGQYRQRMDDYIRDPFTWIAYPVFTNFTEQREIAAVVALNIYWKAYFSGILPPTSERVICVLENSYNQTLVYSVDGPLATFLGDQDPHKVKYDNWAVPTDVNALLQDNAGPENKAYTTVSLSQKFGRYTLRIYPAEDPSELHYLTNAYILVGAGFGFVSIIFFGFAVAAERRRHHMIVQNAEKIVSAERELSEFAAHEIRNPLAAALSASHFVMAAASGNQTTVHFTSVSAREELEEDLGVINSSLTYINEFLRSLLDLHRATENKLTATISPADLRKDVLEPVSTMIYHRDANFEVLLDCPENLILLTDSLRLKQVMLNLARNSSKFVEQGFVKVGAKVVALGVDKSYVQLYVEDSGPGIPLEKRQSLFTKFQSSLDSLSQGTGLGLSLCLKLVEALNGDIWLDESYDSGVLGNPGARIVVQLKLPSPEEVAALCLPADEDHNDDHNEQVSGLLPEELRILFVDDDMILRKLFKKSVQKIAPNWIVVEAASGEKALELCETEDNTFDLIFMDQHMASVDKSLLGTETVRALRVNGVDSVVCGLSANDLEGAFLEAGANFFLIKPAPCEAKELSRVIGKMLQHERR